jgi:hypothetical protein
MAAGARNTLGNTRILLRPAARTYAIDRSEMASGLTDPAGRSTDPIRASLGSGRAVAEHPDTDRLPRSAVCDSEERAMGANTAETALPDTLQKLTDHLTASYAGLLTPAVVREVVQDCYQPLSNARIVGYVPILVEHNSRARLRQLVRRPDPLGMDTASLQGDNADRFPGGGSR